jgi:hypothetical protein
MFGPFQVGAIHGRLLTAWSVAGVLGPVLVNYIREYQIGHGVAKADAYTVTMRIMAGLLVVGFICNSLIRAVDARFAEDEDSPALLAREGQSGAFPAATVVPAMVDRAALAPLLAFAWLMVGLPLAWGVGQVFRKSLDLFR